MRILDERVERYLHDLRPPRSEVMGMCSRWERPSGTRRCTSPSSSSGRVVTFEIDPDQARQARDFWARAGVSDRIELFEGDARETIPDLAGPFDLLFVDAAKGQYREYIELAEPLLSERAALVIDNLLVGGRWPCRRARRHGPQPSRSPLPVRSTPELLGSENWLGSVLPIGDGVGFAARL
jgi:predicted O-methyltransferase YrrM